MPHFYMQNGERKVNHDGYIYESPHESQYFSLWKCEQNDCFSRAKILNGNTAKHVTLLACHNHLPLEASSSASGIKDDPDGDKFDSFVSLPGVRKAIQQVSQHLALTDNGKYIERNAPLRVPMLTTAKKVVPQPASSVATPLPDVNVADVQSEPASSANNNDQKVAPLLSVNISDVQPQPTSTSISYDEKVTAQPCVMVSDVQLHPASSVHGNDQKARLPSVYIPLITPGVTPTITFNDTPVELQPTPSINVRDPKVAHVPSVNVSNVQRQQTPSISVSDKMIEPQRAAPVSIYDATIEELMKEDAPEQSSAAENEENVPPLNLSPLQIPLMYDPPPATSFEMVQVPAETNIRRISTPFTNDQTDQHQQSQTPSQPLDYHTDFDFEHFQSTPPLSEHDTSGHERLPSTDSFKEEEILKPFDQYSMLQDGECFLKYDTGIDDPDRILFFTLDKNLALLKDSDYWGINCVTKKVPQPFIQFWVIHGLYHLRAYPLAYFLVRSTNDSTFERAMKLLPEGIRPKHVMMEFSKKEYKLAQDLFVNARFHYCYFLFTGNVMRKITNYHWIHRYRENEQFHIDVKCFMMLAFVKPADVVPYFNALKRALNVLYVGSQDLNLHDLYGYMEETWIGNPEIGISPVYPIELWNVYDITLLQYPRTNNFFKTWLARYYSKCRPITGFPVDEHGISVYTFIDAIKSLQVSNEFSFQQGNQLPHFGKNNNDILKVVLEYDKLQPLYYLRSLSTASLIPKPENLKRKESA